MMSRLGEFSEIISPRLEGETESSHPTTGEVSALRGPIDLLNDPFFLHLVHLQNQPHNGEVVSVSG